VRKYAVGLMMVLFSSECFAGQKIIIEVVEATEDVLVTGGYRPGTPEKTQTHCKTTGTGDTKTQDCTTVTTPAVPESNTPVRMTITYSAKVILPDGGHALITCAEFADGCGSIDPPYPERTKKTMNGASTTVTGLGRFEAKRDGNHLVIHTPKGKRRYQIMDSW
jgi:hypothetical protein